MKKIIGDCTLYCCDSLELLKARLFSKIGAIVSDSPDGIGLQLGGGGTSGNLKNKCQAVKNLELIHGDDAPSDGRVQAIKSEPRIIL